MLVGVRTEFPDAVVSYEEEEQVRALERLGAGSCDAVITHRRTGTQLTTPWLSDELYDVRDLGTDPYVVAVPASAGEPRRAVTMTELRSEHWISTVDPLHQTGSPYLRETGVLDALAKRSGFEPTIAIQPYHVSACLSMVQQGLGIAVLPRLALRGVPVPDGVRLHHLVDGLSTISVVAGVHVRESPVIRLMLRLLRRALDNE